MQKLAILVLWAGICATISNGSQTEYFNIVTVIQNHFSETTLKSKVLNDQNISAEVGFQILLPKESFITHFEMTINNTVYEGVIEEKQKAKKRFNAAKRRGHTAGLVETREKADKIFSTNVNVGANTAVEFKLVYQQVSRKVDGRYTNKIILFGDQLSRFLTIKVYICEPRPLKNVTVPPIILNGVDGTVDADASISVNGNTAQVSFVGNDQLTRSAVSARGGVFTVVYELGKSQMPAEVIVDNGYFIYFGPDLEIKSKRMIFVLDDSGSMGGHKSNQVKKAMKNVVGKLLPLDRFGIVKFSSTTRSWLPQLVYATTENVRNAVNYIESTDEGSGTRIWDGLKKALNMMKADTMEANDKPDMNMIVLLSDGQGEVPQKELLDNTQKLGEKRFSIHTLSFGNDADDSLLKETANQNHGKWKKILVDLDSALQIEYFVDEIRASNVNELYVENYPLVIAEIAPVGSLGTEIMSVGKFHDEVYLYGNGPHEISYGGFPEGDGIVRAQFFLDQKYTGCGGMEGNQIKNFAAKTFAMTKVKMAIREYEIQTNQTVKEYYKQKAVNLSMEYNLVTAVTSLLVIKPEDEKDIEEEEETISTTTTTTTSAPTTTTRRWKWPFNQARAGRGGGGGPRWSFHSDPHFVARLSNDITVCFNWNGRNNEIVNLLHDLENSIVINGLMSGREQLISKELYVTKLMILLEKDELFVEIDPDVFVVGDYRFGRKGEDPVQISLREIGQRSFVFGILKFHITEIKKYHVILEIRIRELLFVVEIQFQRETNPNSRDHLDLAIPNYEDTFGNLGGIFGHLQMRNFIDAREAQIVQNIARNKTFLIYNDDKIEVRKSHMKIPYLKADVDCWFSKGRLQQLLGAAEQAFELNSLLEIPAVA